MLDWLFGKKKQTPPATPSPPKSTTEQQTQDRWQYEFLLQFLHSPLWRVSILDFVDANCIVFDSEEQNKFAYTKIHNQFKQLVGTLFDGMMQEIGLDSEKLVVLLERGLMSKEHKVFQQLLLCDDFLKFKKLMVKRNLVLESEAIKAMNGEGKVSRIDQDRQLVRQSLREEQERQRRIQQDDDQMLRKVIELSKKQAQEKKEIEQLELRASQLELQKNQKQQDRLENERKQMQERARIEELEQLKRKEQEQFNRQELLKREIKVNEENKNASLGELPPLRGNQKQLSSNDQANEPVRQYQPIPEPSTATQDKEQNPKTQSVQDRKRRLLQQREKLRIKKEQQRKKLLEQQGSTNKVQNIVLQDSGIHDVQPEEKTGEDKVSKEELERRKEIMRKIKNRIVDDF